MKSTISVLMLALTTVIISSCGEDPSGPSGSSLTPSVLSLAFTGDSSKTGSDSNQNEALRFSSTGPKEECEVTASWTICDESEFASYILYKSESPHISDNISSATVLGVFSDPNKSDYVDNDVSWAQTYYYALKLTDNNDESVWSNEASIITHEASGPTPSVLSVGNLFFSSVELHWSQCPDGDYTLYKLYRSDFPDIHADTSLALCVAILIQASDTIYVDVDVTPEQTYYYALLTRDINQYFNWSNEIQVSTPEYSAPDSVVAKVGVGEGPCSIFSLPSGEYVYVANVFDDNVSVIQTSTNTVVETVSVGNNPIGICSLPSGEYLYVANRSDDNVSAIRTSDNSVVETVSVGEHPSALCSHPSGDYVYVTHFYDDNISVIQTSNNTVVETVSVGNNPVDICSLPSGEFVYVANRSGDNVSVIRTSDNTVVETVSVGDYPSTICSLPSGEYVYVGNGSDNNISVIRTYDNTVVETLGVGEHPSALCSLPSGDYVYVTNLADDNVSVIRTSDNAVVEKVNVDEFPNAICSLPSGEFLYVANYGDDRVSVLR